MLKYAEQAFPYRLTIMPDVFHTLHTLVVAKIAAGLHLSFSSGRQWKLGSSSFFPSASPFSCPVFPSCFLAVFPSTSPDPNQS